MYVLPSGIFFVYPQWLISIPHGKYSGRAGKTARELPIWCNWISSSLRTQLLLLSRCGNTNEMKCQACKKDLTKEISGNVMLLVCSLCGTINAAHVGDFEFWDSTTYIPPNEISGNGI